MVRRSCTLLILIVVLVACKRASGNEQGIVFWTPSAPPTQTERVVIWTSTPLYTYTPIVKIVTETPQPGYLCVTAVETVHLRPSPSLENYPIEVLKNGAKLTDLGGRKNSFLFVQYGELSGWVHREYVKNCK